MLFLMTVQDAVHRDKIIYIYQSQYSRMAYTAGKYLHNREDIEDAVQDAMVRLITVIDKVDIDDPIRLKNLCCVVTRNVALNRTRTNGNKILPIEEVFDLADRSTPDPERVAVENDFMSSLITAIDSLGEIYRDVCRLKYINELKESEIAKLLELPSKTVNQRIYRGRQMLKNLLMKESTDA